MNSATEEWIERVLALVCDTVAEAEVSQPAGRGAGYAVDYDEATIRAFMRETFPGAAGKGDGRAAGVRIDRLAADVVGWCYEATNAQTGGQRGARYALPAPAYPYRPSGVVQIWFLRNGQEVRVKWKPPASEAGGPGSAYQGHAT